MSHSTRFVLVDGKRRIRGYYMTQRRLLPQEPAARYPATRKRTLMIAWLPSSMRLLNALSAVLLVWAYVLIRRRRIDQHRKVMLTAFVTSCLFLVCYLVYHYALGGSVPFHHEGTTLRTVYFTILLTHTVLAATVPVLAIMTLRRGLGGALRQAPHDRALDAAIWLYVSVTGVVVYVMLYHIA